MLMVPVQGTNPVVPNVGMADPHVHFWDGMFYMYATSDFAANNTGYLMKQWWVWASPDLVQWKEASTLDPQQTPAQPNVWDECWATDAAVQDGHYYFYLSIGPDQVAVVNSTSPAGPWVSPLSVPLLPASLGSSLVPSTTIRDPCAFTDVDGTQYIVFGTFEYYIARLGPDMVSLAEQPRHITIIDAVGPFGFNKTDDKPFLHTYNGVYYLSWGCFYAMGTSPYGPFTGVGSVITTQALEPAFRMNVSSPNWWAVEDLTDRHGSFFSANGQWYFAANDRSHSPDTANPAYYRDTVIGYVHYHSNGTIAPVAITSTGVGEYSARQPIQAENYFSVHGARKGVDLRGDFGVHSITSNASLSYPNIRHLASPTPTLRLRAANGAPHPTRVVARSGSAAGPVLGAVVVPPTGDWEVFAITAATTPLVLPPGAPSLLHLVLTFEPDMVREGAGVTAPATELLRLDWLALV